MAAENASSDTKLKNHAAFIWSVADLLRGNYRQSEYGRVILPLTVLRRLDCVLEPTKADVLAAHDKMKGKAQNLDPILMARSGEQFYNVSKLTLPKLLDDAPNIADQLNERFGTDWAPEDRFFYDAVAEKLANRTDMQQKAAANDEENFGLVLGDEFMKGVVAQLNTSEDMAIKFIDDKGLQQAVLEAYLPLIYGKAKVANQEHCPVGDLLGPDKESQTLEYKATLRTHAHSGEVYKPLETATLKTLAAFLNSPLGGTLADRRGRSGQRDGAGVRL